MLKMTILMHRFKSPEELKNIINHKYRLELKHKQLLFEFWINNVDSIYSAITLYDKAFIVSFQCGGPLFKNGGSTS